MKDVLGERREYLTIKILHNDMTVMVPTENAAVAGLRRVIDEETIVKVLAVLQDECSDMPKNWNRRFKHNRDKIKTGDIYELAEVVRNLAIREHQKGLSTGEKQMYTRAKKILASEMMYALDMDEEQVDAHLISVILEGAGNVEPDPVSVAAEYSTAVYGGRADRGRRTWRAPWVRGTQGARHRCGPADARMELSPRCAQVAVVEAIVVALPADRLDAAPDGTSARRRRGDALGVGARGAGARHPTMTS